MRNNRDHGTMPNQNITLGQNPHIRTRRSTISFLADARAWGGTRNFARGTRCVTCRAEPSQRRRATSSRGARKHEPSAGRRRALARSRLAAAAGCLWGRRRISAGPSSSSAPPRGQAFLGGFMTGAWLVVAHGGGGGSPPRPCPTCSVVRSRSPVHPR